MTGQADQISITVWYKPSAGATEWVLLDPPGAELDQIEIIEGRGTVVAGPTLPSRYQIRWSVDATTEMAEFDVVRQGLPLFVRFTHPTKGDVDFSGWVTSPAAEDLPNRTVTITAHDGLGRTVDLELGDFVESRLKQRGDITGYWRLDDTDQSLWPSIGSRFGTWYADTADRQASPVRAELGMAQNLTDNLDDAGWRQYATIGTITGAGQVDSSTVGAAFRVLAASTKREAIFGFVEEGILTATTAQPMSVGVFINGLTVTVEAGTASSPLVVGTFTAEAGETYTAVMSYFYSSPNAQVRAHVVDSSYTPKINQAFTGNFTAGSDTFSFLRAGPAPVVVQDLVLIEGTALNLTPLVSLLDDLHCGRGETTYQQWVKVTQLAEISRDVYPDKGEVLDGSIRDLSSVAKWYRQLEATEQGAVYWGSTELKFETLAELQAKTPTVSFGPTGNVKLFTPAARGWTEVRNRAIVAGPSRSVVKTDQASIDTYGDHSITVNVLDDSPTVLDSIADRLLGLHSKPRRTHPELICNHHSSNEWEALFDVSLFDRVSVVWPDSTRAELPHVFGRRIRYTGGVNEITTRLALVDIDPPTGAAPVNTSPPTIPAEMTPGDTAAGTAGTWTGSGITYTYRWQWTLDGGATVQNITGDDGAGLTLAVTSQYTSRQIRLRVGAYNGIGPTVFAFSDWSAVGFAGLAPNTPAPPTLTAGDTEITADWVPPSVPFGGSPITGYEVRSFLHPSLFESGDLGLVLTYTLTGLTNGQEYEVSVRAKNSAGWSPWSQASRAAPIGAPDAPTGLAATFGPAGQVTISWTAPASDGGSAITAITLQRSTTSPTGPWSAAYGVSLNDVDRTVTGLTAGDTYYWRVFYTNALGDGAASSPLTTTLPTVPGAATSFAVDTPTVANELTFTWTAPASDGGSAITAIRVEQAATDGGAAIATFAAPVPSTTLTVTGITDGIAYYWRVVYVTVVGETASTPDITATAIASGSGGFGTQPFGTSAFGGQ